MLLVVVSLVDFTILLAKSFDLTVLLASSNNMITGRGW
jgi:hypothetical protein